MSRKMQAVDTGERDKIYKLKTELKTDSGKDKVEFLYSGDKIDRDAYLIGKPIDKVLIEKETSEKESANQFLTSTIDLSNKIREDPLFEIKKREIEAKRRLLENPLRLKQLKEMISKSKQGDEGRGRSSSESDNEDRRRRHKKKKDKKKKKKSKKRESSSSSSSSSTESESDRDMKEKKRRRRSTSREGGNYGLINRNEPNRNRNRTRSRSRSRSHSPKSKSKSEVEEYKKRINQLKEMRSSGSNRPVRSGGSNVSSKLTEEEKQRRLAEMQSNAKWRDDERSRNVDKYRKEEKNQRQLDEISKTDRMKEEASHLFNNMMNDAYSSTEARIKSNMYNIQRNKSSYDSHFARK